MTNQLFKIRLHIKSPILLPPWQTFNIAKQLNPNNQYYNQTFQNTIGYSRNELHQLNSSCNTTPSTHPHPLSEIPINKTTNKRSPNRNPKKFFATQNTISQFQHLAITNTFINKQINQPNRKINPRKHRRERKGTKPEPYQRVGQQGDQQEEKTHK